MSSNEFRFFLSCDINFPVTFRIDKLEGSLPPSKAANSEVGFFTEERRAELFVECALYIDGAPFGLPMRTRLESGLSFSWNELITLSTKYRDLTAQSQLAFTAIASCLKSRYGMSLVEKMKVSLVELLFFFLTTRNNLELGSKSLGFGLGKKQMAQFLQ
ncbi:hypothetical protein Droror1_Dr00014474 [Drosera rotundifolia]